MDATTRERLNQQMVVLNEFPAANDGTPQAVAPSRRPVCDGYRNGGSWGCISHRRDGECVWHGPHTECRPCPSCGYSELLHGSGLCTECHLGPDDDDGKREMDILEGEYQSDQQRAGYTIYADNRNAR